MTPAEINANIAEALGWTQCSGTSGIPPNQEHRFEIPNYYGDLNACHEMEKLIHAKALESLWLHEITRVIMRECCSLEHFIPGCERSQLISNFWFYHAAAPHRCEAFLRTIGKWVEAPSE